MVVSSCKYLNYVMDFDIFGLGTIQETKHVERCFSILGHVVSLLKIKTTEKHYGVTVFLWTCSLFFLEGFCLSVML